MPDIKTMMDENIRFESNIGRYPLGFRHYENYYNYILKYPKATISEYQNDGKYTTLNHSFLIYLFL